VEEIVQLVNKISAVGRKIKRSNQITVSISTFAPKPHTPFQWVAQISPDEIREKQAFLMENLRRHGIRLKWHNPEMSILEGIFSRGDRRLSEVLIKAHLLGAGFDGWSEHFSHSLWDRAFQECGIDKHFYLRERAVAERLPWEHICCGVSTDFLKAEYQKSRRGEISLDCRTSCCQGCGLCHDKQIEVASPPVQADIAEAPAAAMPPVNHAKGAPYRYRCYFSKSGSARFLSHLELSSCIARTLRRAHLPLQYSQGFHPHPRITFYDALPVGMESQREVFDVELTRHIAPDTILEIINQHLPSGLTIHSAEEITLKKTPAPDTMHSRKYVARLPADTIAPLPSADSVRNSIAAFFSQTEFYVQTIKNGACVTVDIRPLVSHLVLKDNELVEIALNTTAGKIPRVTDILGDILGLGEKERKALQITKLAS
jgi:radical SAM-linked protein